MEHTEETKTQGLINSLVDHWYFFFLICFIEGVIAFINLITIPADPKNQIILGLSASRIIMLAFIAGLSMILLYLAVRAKKNTGWRQKWLHPQKNGKLFMVSFYLSLLVSLLSWATLFITKLYPQQQLLAYYERLNPPLSWLLLLGLQFTLWLAILRFGIHTEQISNKKRDILPLAISLLVIAVISLFICLTGIGVTPDAVAWGEPGVPLLEWQIWLGAFLGILAIIVTLSVYRRLPGRLANIHPAFIDILLALLIWLLAVSLWLSVPIPRSYFSLIPRPPNFEIYPYSDAANHDLVSQQILIGNGFENGRVVKRPLLSLFFAVLYSVGGQNYQNVIYLQTLVLAAFPVFLYLIGKNLHSRHLGIVVAVWGILRELDIIAATPYARVSHSKQLLSDLPAALGIAVFIYLVIKWFKNPGKPVYPVLCGGTLGILMLIRTQCIFLLVLVLPAALLHFRPHWRTLLRDALLIGTGIIMCITPWIIRNWHFTGRFAFDQTEQTGIIAQRYTDLPGYAMPERMEGESEQAYTQRFLKDTLEFSLSNPGAVIQFITAHFLNNELSTILVIPLRTTFEDLTDVFTITSPYWGFGVTGLQTGQYLVLGLNLIILAIGLSASYRRWKIIGLIPLLANLAYSMSNAIARNSGGRYILPVDWVGYFYFAIGILEIIIFIMLIFGFNRKNTALLYTSNDLYLSAIKEQKFQKNILISQVILPCLLLFTFGSTLPLAEVLFPKLYPPQTRQEKVQIILDNVKHLETKSLDSDHLTLFLNDPNTIILSGRAMYPVYLVSGEGEPGFGWPFLEERNYPRMSFYLIGETNSGIILPQELPVEIANTSDVVVAGCMNDGFLDARIVLAEKNDTKNIFISNTKNLAECP